MVFDTNFKADNTERIKLLQSFGVIVTKEEAGLYTHHSVTTFEYEIKHHLNLNLWLSWDFLLNPQPDASGQVPSQTDLYLILGLGRNSSGTRVELSFDEASRLPETAICLRTFSFSGRKATGI